MRRGGNLERIGNFIITCFFVTGWDLKLCSGSLGLVWPGVAQVRFATIPRHSVSRQVKAPPALPQLTHFFSPLIGLILQGSEGGLSELFL